MEQTDTDQAAGEVQDKNSESNLIDALSGTSTMKKEVSIEVNEEIRREEHLQEVIDNSKEVQYSDQITMREPLTGKKSLISYIQQNTRRKSIEKRRSQSPDLVIQENQKKKIIPITMAYMERIMTKLKEGTRRRKRN